MQVTEHGKYFGIIIIKDVVTIHIGKDIMLNRDVHKELPIDNDGASGWIETNTHNTFFYQKKNIENISIMDIAHALSNICRYAGQCNHFYSVAQHSCIIYDVAPNHLKLIGLLHDGAEAYISDIPRPVKTILPQIKTLEQSIQLQIAERFKLSWPYSSQIEILDSQLMLREAQVLFDGGVSWTVDGLDPLHVEITDFWKPKKAKREFLLRYEEETNSILLKGFWNAFHRLTYKRSIYFER